MRSRDEVSRCWGSSVTPLATIAAAQQKIREMPDPEPLISFEEAVKTRKKPGGHAEAAHRTMTVVHLANIAIRTGRKIQWDPAKEEIIGDPGASALLGRSYREPWQLT